MTKKFPHCPHCDSHDIFMEGTCLWDPHEQEWILENLSEDGFCNNCETTLNHSELVMKDYDENFHG